MTGDADVADDRCSNGWLWLSTVGRIEVDKRVEFLWRLCFDERYMIEKKETERISSSFIVHQLIITRTDFFSFDNVSDLAVTNS